MWGECWWVELNVLSKKFSSIGEVPITLFWWHRITSQRLADLGYIVGTWDHQIVFLQSRLKCPKLTSQPWTFRQQPTNGFWTFWSFICLGWTLRTFPRAKPSFGPFTPWLHVTLEKSSKTPVKPLLALATMLLVIRLRWTVRLFATRVILHVGSVFMWRHDVLMANENPKTETSCWPKTFNVVWLVGWWKTVDIVSPKWPCWYSTPEFNDQILVTFEDAYQLYSKHNQFHIGYDCSNQRNSVPEIHNFDPHFLNMPYEKHVIFVGECPKLSATGCRHGTGSNIEQLDEINNSNDLPERFIRLKNDPSKFITYFEQVPN